jgi:PAS domain S-box-containing protein
MAEVDVPGRLVGTTLRPPTLEAEYRLRYLRDDGRSAATMAGGLAFLGAAFIATDAHFVAPPVLWWLTGLRVGQLAVTVALIAVALRTRRPAVLDAWIVAWVAWAGLVIAVVQATRPHQYYLPLLSDLLLVVAAWALLPNRFRLQALSAGLVAAASLTWLFAFRDRPPLPVALLIANSLLATHLAAGYVSWRLQRSRRLQFLAVREQTTLVDRLRESEGQYRSLIENLKAGVVVHAADTSILLANARAGEVLGLTPEQMRGKAAIDPAWRFVREDGSTMPLPEYPVNRVLATGTAIFDQLVGVNRPARGDVAWVLASAYPVLRDGGRIHQIVVTFVDITRRKLVEAELRRSEALRRTITDNFPNGLVGLYDRDLRFVLVGGTSTLGDTPPRAFEGRTLGEVSPPEILSRVEAAYRAALDGEPQRIQVETRGHVVDTMLHPVRNEAGEVTLGLFVSQDVTEKRALEEQLVVASRLAALGTLVAGVAHEINNPLTGELAGQGTALEDVGAVRDALHSGMPIDRADAIGRLDDAIDALRDAQSGGERIARIVKDLTLFGRPDPRRSRVRLVDVVEEAMRWLPGSISRAATIRVENLGAPDVLASPGQLGQVLVNLVTNASRAMEEGRRGDIAIVVGPGSPGMARLEVRDDGAGIAPDVLKRIFDPFFTTRKVGQGTGLGLPICHSIVTAHGGTITAVSRPGAGATFRVEIPVMAEDPGG